MNKQGLNKQGLSVCVETVIIVVAVATGNIPI